MAEKDSNTKSSPTRSRNATDEALEAERANQEEPQENGSMISQDGLYSDGSLEALADRPTVLDSTGIERVAGPRIDSSWRPAPVEPDEAEVARLAEIDVAFADARRRRLGALTDPSIHGETAEPLISANRAEQEGRDSGNDSGESGKGTSSRSREQKKENA